MLSKENEKVWTINNKKENAFLRKKTSDFDFSKYSKKEVDELVQFMRKKMVEYKGVGLSANQIGINAQVFVAQLPDKKGGYTGKFYAIFNPKITTLSDIQNEENEGCLSVPNIYGLTKRNNKVEISGLDKNQRKIKIRAQGFLARIFQHETDHLNGKLFIDTATNLFELKERGEELI